MIPIRKMKKVNLNNFYQIKFFISIFFFTISAEDKKEQVAVTPDIPKPTYTDEEITHLVEYMQRMCMLFALDHRDWSEDALDKMRRWLLEVNELMLTIFYDSNQLTACLGFPTCPVQDLCYFLRMPYQIFNVESFHDEIQYGTIHEDVDGCLMKILQNIYSPVFRNFTEWNDNVKQRFCKALDKFLSYLVGLHYKMAGMTCIYIPYVVKQICQQDITRDREFIKNLESILVFWTTQIRTLLTDKTLVVPHDLVVVVEEYEFWLYRCKYKIKN